MNTQWQDPATLPENIWSLRERSWLLYAGSLTTLLAATTQNQARLVITHENYEPLRPDEYALLKLPQETLAFVREGGWYVDDCLLVATRVVIPEETFMNHGQLRDLGDTPLGKQLFSDPTVIRHPFEIRQLAPEGNPPLWERRSLFSLKGELLLVDEIFYPPIFEQIPVLDK